MEIKGGDVKDDAYTLYFAGSYMGVITEMRNMGKQSQSGEKDTSSFLTCCV